MEVYYTENHEWVRIEEGSIAFVGISDYAASQLGDIVFIKLPEEREYEQNEIFSEIESVKAASDVFSPVSGKVVAVNLKLKDNPEALNNSPQDEGWIAKIKLVNRDQIKSLMNQDSYFRFTENLK